VSECQTVEECLEAHRLDYRYRPDEGGLRLKKHYEGVKALEARQGLGGWVAKGIRMGPDVSEGGQEVDGESLRETWVVKVTKGEEVVSRGAGKRVEVHT
jgi:hypothetical protein